jgi:hypothetical protein
LSKDRDRNRDKGEQLYRIQPIYEHRAPEIRETTRIALREVRPVRERVRLRRVAGYEVLGRRVPWSWDCVSGTGTGTESSAV